MSSVTPACVCHVRLCERRVVLDREVNLALCLSDVSLFFKCVVSNLCVQFFFYSFK